MSMDLGSPPPFLYSLVPSTRTRTTVKKESATPVGFGKQLLFTRNGKGSLS